MSTWSLSEKVILITDGARGIGAATARELASRGARPVLADLDRVEAMCNSLRIEVAAHGVDVATIHPTWIDTDMVREYDESKRGFQLLRAAMRPPFKKTYPVQRAVGDIVAGFEQRRRRICTPRFVALAHAVRPLLTTRIVEGSMLGAAPEMERAFRHELAQRGRARASVSERTASLQSLHGDHVEA